MKTIAIALLLVSGGMTAWASDRLEPVPICPDGYPLSLRFYEKETWRILDARNADWGVLRLPSFTPESSVVHDARAKALVYTEVEGHLWRHVTRVMEKRIDDGKTIRFEPLEEPQNYQAPATKTAVLPISDDFARKLEQLWEAAVEKTEENDRALRDGCAWLFFANGKRGKVHAIGEDWTRVPRLVRLADNLAKAIVAQDTEALRALENEADALHALFAEERDGFALGLYRQLARAEKGNFVCSPHGVALALGMAEAGAAGKTKVELRRAVVPEGVADAAAHFAGKREAWERGMSGVDIANSVWIQEGSEGVGEETARVLEEVYRAETREADFADAAESARGVNEWAAEATGGKVSRVADEGTFGAETGFSVVNATCFEGTWASPFWTWDTHEAVFRAEDGSKGVVEMMFQKMAARLAVREAGTMLCLPYEGGELEFRGWLPPRRAPGALAKLERALAEIPGEWAAWEAAAKPQERVIVHLPRFRAEWRGADLSASLRALGVEEAFGERAEFPGFGGGRLGRVAQSAVLEVDETGTRAAAVTAGFITLGVIPEFRADRPFLYAVVERTTGCVLFMGRMARAQRN